MESQCVGGAQRTVRHKIGSPDAQVQTLQGSDPLGVYRRPLGMNCPRWSVQLLPELTSDICGLIVVALLVILRKLSAIIIFYSYYHECLGLNCLSIMFLL